MCMCRRSSVPYVHRLSPPSSSSHYDRGSQAGFLIVVYVIYRCAAYRYFKKRDGSPFTAHELIAYKMDYWYAHLCSRTLVHSCTPMIRLALRPVPLRHRYYGRLALPCPGQAPQCTPIDSHYPAQAKPRSVPPLSLTDCPLTRRFSTSKWSKPLCLLMATLTLIFIGGVWLSIVEAQEDGLFSFVEHARTPAYAVFDCDFGFDSQEWSCSENSKLARTKVKVAVRCVVCTLWWVRHCPGTCSVPDVRENGVFSFLEPPGFTLETDRVLVCFKPNSISQQLAKCGCRGRS